MRRFITPVIGMFILGLVFSIAQAQGQSRQGDPPVASLISISPADDTGVVTISGAAGAVFPGAQVAIRNLFTGQLVVVPAGVTGTFTARLFGPGNTPFWISPATAVPTSARGPGSLPGGPGTIVYGAFPVVRQTTLPVTRLVMDGLLDDWQAYPQAAGASVVYGLRNQESLYFAFEGDIPAAYQQLRLTLTIDGAALVLSFDPRLLQTATLRRLSPNPADLGTLPVAAVEVGEVIEARVPLAPLDSQIEAAALTRVQFVDDAENVIDDYALEQALPLVDEIDGIVYIDSGLLGTDVKRFSISGPVARGASTWTARGRINALRYQPGDSLFMEMDVTMQVPDLPPSLVGLRMIGEIGLQPVIGAEGVQAAGGLNSNNGWSSVLTPSGLAIDNLRGDFVLGRAEVSSQQVIRRGEQLIFGLQFDLKLPEDLPPGFYVPIFHGKAQIGDGDVVAWEDNGLLGTGNDTSRVLLTRLPVVLTVGELPQSRLAWALFFDTPSDGSRGILADEDRAFVALSNRVRFDSPTYILPPGNYPVEPYLLSQMPNNYDTSGAPLIPLLTPGGRLNARVFLPDGTVDDTGATSFAQSWLSTAAQDERSVFGGRSPVDVYRLTTLNPRFTQYVFDQYGPYRIALEGSVEDVWGNRYDGGGTYHLLIAELLDITPGVLPGTPFQVGDVFNPSLRVAPGVPAEVTLTVRVFPLDGSPMVEQILEGTANSYGYFLSDARVTFDTPGEYIIDYEARFTDAEGRLWAGSQRSAGVIATPDNTLVAHGRRGLDGYYPELRPAWFNTRQYPQDVGRDVPPVLNAPYHSGDVAWIVDSATSGIRPIIQVQDREGVYERWLLGTLADYVSPMGRDIAQLAVEDALPLISVLGGPPSLYNPALLPDLIVNQGYAYVSAVRPDVTVRQFIQGSDDDGLLVSWDADDPYNGQIGAGISGDRPMDFAFIFGGAVVRNAEAGIHNSAIYAALAVTTESDDFLGPRVYPPYRGAAGGPDGGPLFTLGGEAVEMFFLPTGAQPGQVFTRGDTLAVAGHVGPPLASRVFVTVTAPSGKVQQFDGLASAVGYFCDPAHDLVLDEAGVWQVEITVQHDGLTSTGQVEAPLPSGHVLGAAGGRFPIYVLPPNSQPLDSNQASEAITTIRAGSPINFVITIPDGWTDIKGYQTVTMPGYVLDSGQLQIFGRQTSYQYSPFQLKNTFPNLESDGRGEGAASSDVVTVTFVITGRDESGVFQARSRTFTVMHDRLLTLDGVRRE